MFVLIGFVGVNIFYDVFLVDVIFEDRMDWIFIRGFVLGYIGSIIFFIGCIVFIIFF